MSENGTSYANRKREVVRGRLRMYSTFTRILTTAPWVGQSVGNTAPGGLSVCFCGGGLCRAPSAIGKEKFSR